MKAATGVHIQTHRGNNVRIGPVSIITLIAVICMAVLSVLTASTSHATSAISERQANASQQMYLNECAGQEFVAGIDDVLARNRAGGASGTSAARDVDAALDSIVQKARDAADGRVSCTAKVEGTTVTAEFICDNARLLNVQISIRDDASFRIEKWKMASVQQGTPSAGTLWLGA